ncbi:hypothetical protein DV738_g5025, partial [Chaetothyriales sp. CBS 135597]
MEMDPTSVAIANLTANALDKGLLEPKLDAFLDRHHTSLTSLIRRQVGLIQQRSADPADNQVTIYDMTLLRLTEGGNDVDFTPALHFFCKEFLGINEHALDDHLLHVHEQLQPADLDHSSTTVASQWGSGAMAEPDTQTRRRRHSSSSVRAGDARVGGRHRAREDYMAIAGNDDRNTFEAAKFLRDTVENLLDSVGNGVIDTDKRRELDAMAAVAKEAVEKLCGGRKRKFDIKRRHRHDHGRTDRYRGAGESSHGHSPQRHQSEFPGPSPQESQQPQQPPRGSPEERGVVRRLDRRLVLFLSLLYLLSFLDRSNIGNARIAGLESSPQLSSSQYDWLLTAFYICYIAFEWMIMLYRVLPARVYVPLCVLSWGIVASVQSVATNFTQMLVLRGLLGVAEAAFGPGVPFYLSFFYKRSELAYRVGLQISAAPLATSFASSLAWLVVRLSRNGPVESWRVLFLVEGFPSVLAAVAAWYWIPNGPADASWLSERERPKINWSEILHTLADPKCYLTALMFFSVNVSFASLPVFLPTIINAMEFSPLASQALAAPPYLCAFVFLLVIAYKSDRVRDSRSLFLIGAALLSAASYAAIALAGALRRRGLLGDTASIIVRYSAVYGAAIGLFTAVTLIITWTLNNQASAEAKGTGMVVLNLVGQCGPLVGVRLFPKTHGPEYVPGMAVCAAFMTAVAVLSGVMPTTG